MTDYILRGILLIFAVIMIIYYKKSKRPVLSIISILSGIAGLSLVYFFGGNIGITLPISVFNILFSAVLGIPGVIILLLFHFFTGG